MFCTKKGTLELLDAQDLNLVLRLFKDVPWPSQQLLIIAVNLRKKNFKMRVYTELLGFSIYCIGIF